MRDQFFACITAASISLLAGGLATVATSTPAWASNPGTNLSTAPANWTPLILTPHGQPRAFRGSDGKYNLIWEIECKNFNQKGATIDSLQIVDKDNVDRVLLDLSGDKLSDVFMAVPKSEEKSHMAAGGLGIGFINVVFENEKDVPKSVLHRIRYHLDGASAKNDGGGDSDSNNLDNMTELVGQLDVVQKAPVVIASPLAGGKWIAAGGYCGKLGHRRAIFPLDNKLMAAQKYAIDWVRADDKNYTRTGDLKSNEASRCYNEPVYAARSGKVVGVQDKFKDQKFGTASGDIHYPGGNHITIEAEPGIYTFYAHLKPGSILVKEGDSVKQGDQIASLGNSGNSDGPHLHFHVTDGPQPLGSEGIPYVYQDFELVGNIKDIDLMVKEDEQGKPITIEKADGAGLRHGELIKEGHVVVFPAAAGGK